MAAQSCGCGWGLGAGALGHGLGQWSGGHCGRRRKGDRGRGTAEWFVVLRSMYGGVVVLGTVSREWRCDHVLGWVGVAVVLRGMLSMLAFHDLQPFNISSGCES